MELTVALEARYQITPDGCVWSQAGMDRRFWERYLEVFDKVNVLARTHPTRRPSDDWLPVNAENIVVHAVPDYHGPSEYLEHFWRVEQAIRSAAPVSGAVILRVASHVANRLLGHLRPRKHPFALEVVGDPYDVFSPGVVDHPLRGFFRWYFSRQLRRQCRDACGVAYVTKQTLQRRYPSPHMTAGVSDVDLPHEAILNSVPYTHYSSIELESSGIAGSVRKAKQAGPYRIVMVGSLAQLYKGPDVLIDAVACCVNEGVDLTAIIVGDGQFRPALMARAARLGLGSRIEFAGQVTAGEPVRRILDAADLFVLPSRTEGLPRAMIEAMARALPCVGSAVGGIPELLHPDDLVPAGDKSALARKIREVLRSPERLAEMSRRNLEASLDYRDTVLAVRRRQFYQYVKDYTASWQAATQGQSIPQ